MTSVADRTPRVAGDAEIAAALILATTLLEHAARPGAELAEVARLSKRAVRVLVRLRVCDERLATSPASRRFETALDLALVAIGHVARQIGSVP